MVGQKRIKKLEKSLVKTTRKDLLKMNFLLTGKAGLGKTHALYYLGKKLERDKNCVIFNPEEAILELLYLYSDKEIFIIDEVHRVKDIENLYPFMVDRLCLFATNLPDKLAEAFYSRCIVFHLEEYTTKELVKIAENKYPKLSKEHLKVVANRARGTPREALQIASLINMDNSISLEELGYFEDGFREKDYRYLDYLKSVEEASLLRIQESTGLSDREINDTESFLIKKGLISITNRRRFND